MKFIKRIFVILIFITAIINTGCSKIQPDIINFSGAGNTSGNFVNMGLAAETDRFIYLYTDLIYKYSKTTEEVIINCSDPSCQHITPTCSAYIESEGNIYSDLQTFDDKLFIIHSSMDDVLFEIESSVKKPYMELGNLVKNILGSYRIYDNKLIFFTQDEELKIVDIYNHEQVITIDNVTQAWGGFFIDNNYIYFTNRNMELIKVSLEGEHLSVLEDDKASRAMMYNSKLFYIKIIENNPTLIKVNSDGTNPEILMDSMLYYNIIEDYIFFTKVGESGLFRSNLNGEGIVQISDLQAQFIFVFNNYDKILFTVNDMSKIYSINSNGESIKEHILQKPFSEEDLG